MTEPYPANDADDQKDPVEAGLRAVFEEEPGEALRDSQKSIVQLLADASGAVSRIRLRDVDAEASPVRVRGRTHGAPELPAQVGRYRIGGEIARGGVGAVYRAHDVDLGRDVALKVLLDGHEKNPDMLRRFVEEAQIGGQLQHPGVCSVHEMGLLGGDRPYFTMKLVKGRTLSALLAERRNSSVERQRFLGIFEQIAQTLAYAHARGVIHRDLKPSNVMVGAFGEVQVMDWGLSKVLSEGGADDDRREGRTPKPTGVIETLRFSSGGSRSLTGSVMGTPAYMPPEQARGEVNDLDERSDVFGLGAVLCEILTGKPPYVGDGLDDVYRKAKKAQLEDAMARLDACGADEAILDLPKRCLAREPRERPKDAGTVAAEISAYLASLEERARTLEIRAAKTRLRYGLAASVLAVLLIGVVGYSWNESARRSRLADSEHAVREALVIARERHEEARQRGRADLATWRTARDAVTRAESLLTAEIEGSLHQQVSRLKELNALLARFDEIFTHTSLNRSDRYGQGYLKAAEEAHRESLQRLLGDDLMNSEVHEAARRVSATDLEKEIAAALEQWALLRRALRLPWEKPLRIAIDADRDPARTRLRVALFDRERTSADDIMGALREVQGSDHIHLVNALFEDRKDRPELERALRTIVAVDPAAYHPQLALGELLLQEPSAAPEEALRHLEVAKAEASNPSSWGPRLLIGEALLKAYRYEEALTEWSEGAVLFVHHAVFHNQILWLLDARSPPFRGSVEALIEQYIWLLRTEEIDNPILWEVLGLAVAMDSFAHGETAAAIRALEEIPLFREATRQREWLLESWRSSLAPDHPSYASIDAAMEGTEVIVSHGSPWQLFRGKSEPPRDWKERGFDGASWEEAKCPIGSNRWDTPHAATTLGDIENHETGWPNYSTLYLRHTFDIPDPHRFQSVELVLRSTEAFVVYLNGKRLWASGLGDHPEPLPHNATSTEGHRAPKRYRVELPLDLLETEGNVVAIQTVLMGAPMYFLFEIAPSVRAQLVPDRAKKRAEHLLAAFRDVTRSPGVEERIAYFETRLHEASGDLQRAIAGYREIIRRDPSLPQPFERLAGCLLRQGPDETIESELRGLIALADHPSVDLWHLWLTLSFVDLGRSPREVLDVLPSRPDAPDPRRGRIPFAADGYHRDLHWLLTRLAEHGTVRINCGGPDYRDKEGRVWGGDRFFTAGTLQLPDVTHPAIGGATDPTVYQTGRWFFHGSFTGYRIPLPLGHYRVTLHFVEITFASPGRRLFDVTVEGRPVATRLDLRKAAGMATAFRLPPCETEVLDGVLDIGFEHRIENPVVVAFEIESLTK